MKAIKDNIPNAKLILCVRNPADRAYSNFQMNRKSYTIERTLTFDRFKNKYAPVGYYFKHIKKNVLPFFDRKQLYICIVEQMKNDTTNEMNKLFNFLEVSHLNLTSKIISDQLLKHRNRKEDIKLNSQEQFYRVWLEYKQILTGSLRKEILEFYKIHNEKMFKFLGYEIEEWKK